MIENLLISMLIIAISIVLLCINLLIKKNGRFPNIHVSGNKALRKKKIHCVLDQDRETREDNPNKVKERV